MPLANGQIFTGYTIIRLLGSGGMGEVYLAQHPRLPRRDALKLLPREWSADEEFRARFAREADLASTLWHPHIVGVHDRGEEDGQLWISMDFVDGLDAARLLAERYPAGMPVEEVVRIITAVASALDYAHKQHLLHRDVKPANIMMTHLDDEGEQRILLTDFGIARHVNDISGLTKTNMTVGTVAYCAPEQLLGEEVDGRADQYSLAATAFHLLTGSRLFENSNPAVVISRHLNVPPQALADRRPELANLDSVLAIGLAKQPGNRFMRCSDFAHALDEQVNTAGRPTSGIPTKMAQLGTAKPEANAEQSQGHSLTKKDRRSRLVAAAAVTLALIIAAGLMIAWWPWGRQPQSRSTEPSGFPTSASQISPPVAPGTPSPVQMPARAAPVTTSATPGTTTIVTAVAVANGQPANGYREAYNDSSNTLIGCNFTSPAAVNNNIYSCAPFAAGADVCWPSPPATMLCLVDHDPWEKGLHRFMWSTAALASVSPPTQPAPFAVLLDDGTRCKYFYKALGERDDGYAGWYGCGIDALLAVDANAAIDRSQPLWTVKVGQVGGQTSHFPPPQTHTVVTAWFAGTS